MKKGSFLIIVFTLCMATQAKTSRLDNEAKTYRNEKVGKLDKYVSEINEYSKDNDSARSHNDESHPHGKGTGTDMSYAVRNTDAPKTQINYSNVKTDDAGGSYDRFGTKGVQGAFQGDSGRAFLEKVNIYGKDNAYGQDSVDIDTSVRGQFIVK